VLEALGEAPSEDELFKVRIDSPAVDTDAV
jgi:hypothetical protein